MYRYIGNGDFYQGIPARDLDDADFAALDEEQRALVAASPLYEAVKPAPAKPAAEPAAPAPAEETTKEQ